MSGAPLVVLDIGETLVNGPSRGPASRIAKALGLDFEQKRTLHVALMTEPFASPAEVHEFARGALGDLGPRAERAISDVWAAQETEAEPVRGALEALAALHDSGVRLALLSNVWLPYLESARRHFGEFFDHHVPERLQVFSFRAGVAKPDPAAFRRVLDAAGAAPANAVMIGDSLEKDVEPAAALGMGTVWVRAEDGEPAINEGLVGPSWIPPIWAVRSIAEVDLELVTRAVAAAAAQG